MAAFFPGSDGHSLQGAEPGSFLAPLDGPGIIMASVHKPPGTGSWPSWSHNLSISRSLWPEVEDRGTCSSGGPPPATPAAGPSVLTHLTPSAVTVGESLSRGQPMLGIALTPILPAEDHSQQQLEAEWLRMELGFNLEGHRSTQWPVVDDRWLFAGGNGGKSFIPA